MTWEQKNIENYEVSREFLRRLRKYHRESFSGFTVLVRKEPDAALQILRNIRAERTYMQTAQNRTICVRTLQCIRSV